MAGTMGELDARQQEHLRAALAAALAEHFAYPGYYSFALDRLRVRPLDRAKRQEIATYIGTVGFAPLGRMAVDSAELRHYFEGVFLRYLDVNPHLAPGRLAPRRAQLRVEARRIAEEVQQELLDFLAGVAPNFGATQPPTSWTERSPQASAAAVHAADVLPAGSREPTIRPLSREIPPHAADVPASRVGPHKLPASAPVESPRGYDTLNTQSSPEDDQRIFSQLRLQLEAYIRLAVRSYGLPERGGDPARALDDLRSSGLVDDTNLSLAERILALADRVMEQGSATVDDYRQALTLYLLYHRSHLKG